MQDDKRKRVCMRCQPMEERRLTETKFGWRFPILTQPKLDGERCEFHYDKGLLSSTHLEIEGVPHIREQMEKLLRKFGDVSLITDGELYNHELDQPRFEKIHSICSRLEVNLHDECWKMQYHIFDIVDFNLPQHKRTTKVAELRDFVERHPHEFGAIKFVQTDIIFTIEDVYIKYNDYVNQTYEGIILRSLDNMFVRKRNTMVMKFKPRKSDTYTIAGITEAVSKHGQPLGMVGSFQLFSGSEIDDLFTVSAGSLTHEERQQAWWLRDELIGKANLLVHYQSITNGKQLRFGVAAKILT